MTYSDDIIRRHRALVALNNENVLELTRVLAQRAQDRMEGREQNPELTQRTESLRLAALALTRDWLRLRADMIEEQMRRTAPADPFQGLTVPDFMPGEGL